MDPWSAEEGLVITLVEMTMAIHEIIAYLNIPEKRQAGLLHLFSDS